MFCHLRHIIAHFAVMLALLGAGSFCALANNPFVVAIDAGHGGKDLGCQSGKLYEKNITLDVARRLKKLINNEFADSVKVVMTRSDDSFIALDRRAEIANDAQAQLFISIHVNSIDRRSKGREKVHGASVYTVGLHKTDANLAVAMRENSVIELEQDYTETYQGFDPESDESYIIFELGQNLHMNQSVEFATMAQQELVATAGRADKGVRQAGFLVLWATKMPAALVELDFICNPEAAAFLGTENGRQKCARALMNSFRQYIKNMGPRADVNT